jgi:predicted dehydrogenase
MKGGWPIEAQGLGGRHYRGTAVDQNFDIYSVEHTFADGVKLLMNGRTMPGCHEEFASYIHGTKGMAAISGAGLPGRCTIYKGQNLSKSDIVWKSRPREPNAYQAEWDALIDAIRDNKPFNEAKQGAEASLVTSMGRMAAHTGKVVTYDEMLNCEHEFAPNIEKLTLNSPAPLVAGPDGKYPVPQPGVTTQREY